MNISACSFSGDWHSHYKAGYKYIPIETRPSMNDIEEAEDVVKTGIPHSGLNGRAYFWGEDLVVKKYMPPTEAVNYNPEREIDALELLHKKGCDFNNVQKGKYAFKTPDGGVYLVSTRIEGSKPDLKTNPFNKDNLSSLVDTIGEMDMPQKSNSDIRSYDYDEKFYYSIKEFPYEVLMHYDLAPGNLVISDKKGGVIDLEYLKFEDLDDKMKMQKFGYIDCNCNFSDIAGIPSNLRNFEYRTLHNYMMKQTPAEANKLFKDYIDIKSDYHKKKADFYAKEAEKTGDSDLSQLCLELSDKEKTHAKLLKTGDNNILKAEAMKIQLASFINTQSPYARSGKEKVNIEQIKNYVDKTFNFFKKAKENAKSREEATYYDDCINLVRNWMDVKGWIKSQIRDFLYVKGAENDNTKMNKKMKDDAKIFINKLTLKEQKTLDEHIFDGVYDKKIFINFN